MNRIIFCSVLFFYYVTALTNPNCTKTDLNSVKVNISTENTWTAYKSNWTFFECATLKDPVPVKINVTLNNDTIYLFNESYTVISENENYTILYLCHENPSPSESLLLVLLKNNVTNFEQKVKIFKNGNETTIKLNGTCSSSSQPIPINPAEVLPPKPINPTEVLPPKPVIPVAKIAYIFETAYTQKYCFKIKENVYNISDESSKDFNKETSANNTIYKNVLNFNDKTYNISKMGQPKWEGVILLRIQNAKINRDDSFFIFSNSSKLTNFTEEFVEENKTYTITTKECPSSGNIINPLFLLSIITMISTTIINL